MGGKSYDPRMEQLPLLISYPRSGSNWLNCVMELYFNRPRLRTGGPTFLPGRRSDFMWFHDHDIPGDLTVGHDNIFYLYRDPVEVIFSILMAEHKRYDKKLVDVQSAKLRNNLKKYLVPGRHHIRLDIIKSNLGEFQKIVDWLTPAKSLDMERLKKANESVSLPRVIARQKDKRYFNKQMLSGNYAQRRTEFRHEFGTIIYECTIKGLESFFQGINE